MDIERNILLAIWTVCIAAVYFLVSKTKVHEFVLCFLACQAVGWLVELLLVQLHFVAYPLREFPKASDLNITAKLVWTPIASGLYYIFRPRGSLMAHIVYLAAWVALLTLVDGVLAANTRLVDYIHFHWGWMALVFAVILLCVHGIATWFFKDRTVFRKEAGQQ